MDETINKHYNGQPITITISKGMKNNYGWEIKINTDNEDDALVKIDVINEKLKKKYGEKEE